MTAAVQDRIVEIIAEQALMDPADVALDAKLEDLGLDSLGLVEMIFAIEESFDINVPFNANEPQKAEVDLSSVQSIVAAVTGLIATQSGRV